jgi:hypothetical protein
MPIVHANGEIAELIFTFTRTVLFVLAAVLATAPPTPASGAGG